MMVDGLQSKCVLTNPVSENLLFMMTTIPFLMMEVFLSRSLFGDGWQGVLFH
ncbi:MAG: hypothetical protein CM15mP71_5180 [Candidatus Poseidoniales archaeon]|nr:MAG: hypothetical protein CM15mP71_5180 [Candidatus Poseidoniales archaeon]